MDIVEVNRTLLSELESLGFPRGRSVNALHHSGNSSIEEAINWIINNENDPNIDKMHLIAFNIEIDSPKHREIPKDKIVRRSKLRKKEDLTQLLRSFRRKYMDKDAEVKRMFLTLLTYVENVVRTPNIQRFRRIRIANQNFQERVGRFDEGTSFLELCGFQKVNGGMFLFISDDDYDSEFLLFASLQLKSALTNPFFGLLSY